jgi:hypothetical protein
MTMKADAPKPRRPRPASRELRCGICGQVYTYPLKGQNATRRLCAACAALPASVSLSMLRMAGRIRELEKELKTLSEKLTTDPSHNNGESS